MRIGVDVGGTNTDAVLMDGERVLAWAKATTSEDVSGGIVRAITEVLASAGVRPGAVRAVMIGTTHFTNALVERRRLVAVGVIRVALPASGGLPPLLDWPGELVEVVGNNAFLVRGGYEVTGGELAALDEAAVAEAARALKRAGVSAIAISSVFSPLNPAMEARAAAISALWPGGSYPFGLGGPTLICLDLPSFEHGCAVAQHYAVRRPEAAGTILYVRSRERGRVRL